MGKRIKISEAPIRTLEDHRRIQWTAERFAEVRFRFAKTMPEIPHSYTLRRWWAKDEDFCDAVMIKREHGYDRYWYRKKYPSIDLNGFTYWTMGAALNTRFGEPYTIVINRKRTDSDSPYDDVAHRYDEEYETEECKIEVMQVASILGPQMTAGRRVLDVGCGTGLLLDLLDIKPEFYHGIDPSEIMLRRFASKHPAHWQSLLRVKFADVYPTRRYDEIVALFGSGAWLTPSDLEKLPLMLNPGGRWVIMTFDDVSRQPALGRFGFTEVLRRESVGRLERYASEMYEIGYHRLYIGYVNETAYDPSYRPENYDLKVHPKRKKVGVPDELTLIG